MLERTRSSDGMTLAWGWIQVATVSEEGVMFGMVE